MVDLPADAEGLSWIASREPTRLLLIPGLQASSVLAAAAGDQEALAYVCLRAQHPAEDAGSYVLNPLERACAAASKAKAEWAYKRFLKALFEKDPQLASIFKARQLNTRQLLHEAACKGELSAIKWIRAICRRTFKTDSRDLMMHAARNGHLEVLKYLCSGPNPAAWDPRMAGSAARHLDCIQWLLSTDASAGRWPCEWSILGSIACHHGLSALKWFWTNGELPAEVWNENLLLTAAHLGDQPMVEWLRGQAVPWSSQITNMAARENLSMLQWLRAQDPPCPWDIDRCTEAAASAGKLDVLIWLRGLDPSGPWSERYTELAADPPNPEVLQWLHDQGCPFGATTASRAALNRDLAVLEWLHSAGCPMSSNCLICAACAGSVPVLQWLCDQGYQLTSNLYLEAAYRDHPQVLRFLHRMKVPLPRAPVNRRWFGRTCNLPGLMFCSDLGMQLPAALQRKVDQARRAHCTFHGLVRWCSRAISDPSRGAHQAFDYLAPDGSGQLLLTRLCLLPPELIRKIAVAAQLQHGIFESSALPCQQP